MMEVGAAFEIVERHRGDAVVIPCQTARKPWFEVSQRPELDILFRGAMGKGTSLGLGIALGRPDRKVIVFDGDGSLLMNLGSLVTIIGSGVKNLYVFVLENGVYAGTGGQPIPNQGGLSFSTIAKGCGFPVAEDFDDLDTFTGRFPELIAQPGPVFGTLRTHPIISDYNPDEAMPHLFKSCADVRQALADAPEEG